jgi:hypothetical protein
MAADCLHFFVAFYEKQRQLCAEDICLELELCFVRKPAFIR